MRKVAFILIALIALLALAGGGVAVYLLLLAPKEAAEEMASDDPPPPIPAKRPAFVPLEPFSLYVKPAGQPVREMIAIFHLEVPPDNVPLVNEKMHLLRDRYIAELLKGPPLDVPDRFTAKDLYSLRDRLQKPTDDVLGKGIVTQVLLLNIIGQLK
ncbi:hypothetical protein [Ferrovibrio sp.]|uniref:hypothetical protein n=1 Tax=Ferrovibrio sp. TaxID=1917215 RepID=UPI00311E4112